MRRTGLRIGHGASYCVRHLGELGSAGCSFGSVFNNDNFPALNAGLAWDISLLCSNGIVQVVAVVPEPATLLPVGLILMGLLWRAGRPNGRGHIG